MMLNRYLAFIDLMPNQHRTTQPICMNMIQSEYAENERPSKHMLKIFCMLRHDCLCILSLPACLAKAFSATEALMDSIRLSAMSFAL